MTTDEMIKEKIRPYLTEAVGDESVLTDDTNVFQENMVNSAFALRLVVFVEDTFEIEVEDEDLDLASFSSIDAITRFVRSKGV